MAAGVTAADASRPYPFCLASPIDSAVESAEGLAATLGNRADWLVEWKWDGIRAQLVKRGGAVSLWSRGEELITHRFPEIVDGAGGVPDGTVLDGEVLAFRGGRPLPFSALQQRIGREKEVARTARGVPVVFMTFDVLEHEGRDCRPEPLPIRRALLEQIIARAERHQQSAPPAPRAPESLWLPLDTESPQRRPAARRLSRSRYAYRPTTGRGSRSCGAIPAAAASRG